MQSSHQVSPLPVPQTGRAFLEQPRRPGPDCGWRGPARRRGVRGNTAPLRCGSRSRESDPARSRPSRGPGPCCGRRPGASRRRSRPRTASEEVATATSPTASSAAAQGRRRAHLIRRSGSVAGTGADRQDGRASARDPRPGLRPSDSAAMGAFSRHFRTIVSRSRSILGLSVLGRTGSCSRTSRSVSSIGLGAERRAAGQQLEEDRPQGVDVDGRRDRLASALGLLGGHVAGRAHDRAGVGQAGRVEPSTRLARPKSVTSGTHRSPAAARRVPCSRILAGFKSRCRMPRWWA